MTTISRSNRACPECEQPLPPDAPEGLCPECLMLGGLETMPMPENLKPSGRLPETGETFGGYRIGRELGRGGMGAVFEAEQIETGRRVALKLLNHQLDSPDARARFLREGRLAASINHPNSVYVFGTEEIGDMPAIAMELVAGGTLEERVKEEGPLAAGEAVDTILQVIAGLEAAQEIGILHRDVKPGNCFQDVDGTVKIGDFGLSISTEARDEKHLTMDGSIFGTPAFASPEQLRGDELNARSDIYAVGATLYYLLTGQPAFRGKSVAQLFANVLEGKAPSPKEIRPELPGGLATVVMRCLEKASAERFENYLELRKALAPFRSDAPVPAPLPLRFAAGMIDWTLYCGASMIAQFLILGGPAIPKHPGDPVFFIGVVLGFTGWILYFTLMEGHLGYSLGKEFCRLRVVGMNGSSPGYLKAALRAMVILLVPSLPVWLHSGLDSFAYIGGGSKPMSFVFLSSYYLILALLFVTARRRNWFASVFDLMTKTRVIRRKIFQDRPGLRAEAGDPVVAIEETPRIGPYHVLEHVGKDGDSEWVVGYDARLLRKIWIRTVPAGTEPVSSRLRQLGRVGRLRWIGGRRSANENWDAYESPGGQSLAGLTERERPVWSSVRYWLLDLAEELEAAEADGTLPEKLSLDRVWITSGGRAKLLDFPAPGESGAEADIEIGGASALIGKVSAVAAPPLPLHAVSFRESLARLATPAALVAALKASVNRFPTVTRRRRAALVAGCLVFPLLSGLMMLVGFRMMDKWHRDQPEIMALNQILSFRETMRFPFMRSQKSPEDRVYSIFIASRYREAIEDPVKWNTGMARLMIAGKKRQFAERSLVDFPNPTSQEISNVESQIEPIIRSMANPFMEPWFPLATVAASLIFYACIPAILAAVICRGGLVMLACGVAVVRRDGRRASRLHCLWRSLITWSPVFVALFSVALLTLLIGVVWATAIVGVFVVLVTAFSLWLPGRGLQDRIAGTWLVPR